MTIEAVITLVLLLNIGGLFVGAICYRLGRRSASSAELRHGREEASYRELEY